jgi:hypothetical protein
VTVWRKKGQTIKKYQSVAMDVKIKEFQEKVKKPWTEEVPIEYHAFPEVFERMEFDSLPERRPWDHAIDFNLELIWKS